jgi:glycosyltransferase involved in cell wall biosynthesis
MTEPTATVIISAIGGPELAQAVQSVKSQTYQNTQCFVVIDGPEYDQAVRQTLSGVEGLTVLTLPWNTGAGGYNGQYIRAAASMMVKTDYVLYLDQDNWYEPTHVENCMALVKRGVQWCHSLRQIVSKNGTLLGTDDCESLGRWPIYLGEPHHMVDTSCYCVGREAAQKTASAWLKLWGEDRQFYAALSQNYRSFACTGRYTVNYRLGGNENSVNWEFFENGNAQQAVKYPQGFPWRK